MNHSRFWTRDRVEVLWPEIPESEHPCEHCAIREALAGKRPVNAWISDDATRQGSES